VGEVEDVVEIVTVEVGVREIVNEIEEEGVLV